MTLVVDGKGSFEVAPVLGGTSSFSTLDDPLGFSVVVLEGDVMLLSQVRVAKMQIERPGAEHYRICTGRIPVNPPLRTGKF